MRKTMITMGLGLALTLGGAGTAIAQSAPGTPAQKAPAADGRSRTDGDRMERRGQRRPGDEMRRSPRGDRGPGPLLRGIELTADQQAKVKALHEQRAGQARSARGSAEPRRERGARSDTAARLTDEQRRQVMEQRRAQMEQRRTEGAAAREQYVAQLRSILTPEQRVTLDANLKEMSERAAKAGPGSRRPEARRPAPR